MLPQKPKLKILFLCTGNSCRSQMAEGFARYLKSDAIEPYSAGTDPHGINPRVIKVMAEAGIDISRQASKHVSTLTHISFDFVITVCDHAQENCPIFLGRGDQTKILHVGFDDPPRLAQSAKSEEEILTHYRRIRDQIHVWIQTLPHSLLQPPEARMKACLAETLGTFSLVFAGTGAIIINDLANGAVTHVGVALTFGLIIMAMIHALGDISGAHFNPAVTLAFFLAKRLPGRAVVPYLASQITGALFASTALFLLFGNHKSLGASLPFGPQWQSFFLEIILTFILMFVILRVATGSKETGATAGIAIGGTIALEALFAGPISGASMNPARSLAPALLSANFSALWLYLTAPILGAALAVPCWHLTRITKEISDV